MHLRRVRVVDRIFAAALAHVSKAVMPPAPAAKNLGVGIRRPCRGQTFGGASGIGAFLNFVSALKILIATHHNQSDHQNFNLA
jgi:hypothetical protein